MAGSFVRQYSTSMPCERPRGSLGIALMGAILASYVHVPPRTPRYTGEFVHGLHHALLVSAAIAFSAALVGVATVRKVRHAEAESPEPALEAA